MNDKLFIKALGQTIEHEGKVVLVAKEIPSNCMVLFIDMEIWKEIKEQVILV